MKKTFISACVVNLLRTSIAFYTFFSSTLNFQNAVQICYSINATVLFINNSTEDDFVKTTFLNNTSVTGIWLAIYDFTGNEINVNYYTNQTFSYANWQTGQPGSSNQLCTSYKPYFMGFGWDDTLCSDKFSVLCENTEYAGTLNTFSSTNTDTTTTITKTDTTTTISITHTTVTSMMNINLWNEWSPWSLCQFYRQRNNSYATNGIEYQILNISCNLICKNNS